MSSDDQSDDRAAEERGIALRKLASERGPGWIECCLDAALEDPHPFVRSEGAAGLETAPDDVVVPLLASVMDSSVPAAHRWRAERLLIRRDPAVAVPVLAVEAACADAARSCRAIEALARLGRPALPHLVRAAHDGPTRLRRTAAKALAGLEAEESADILGALLDDPESDVRRAALASLARLAARPGAIPWITRLGSRIVSVIGDASRDDLERGLALALAARLHLSSADVDPREMLDLAGDAPVRLAAVFQLIASRGDASLLRDIVSRGGVDEVRAAVQGLAAVEAPPDCFAVAVGNPDVGVRLSAVRGLAAHPGHAVARDMLERARDDADEGVRWLAARALGGHLDARRVRLHEGRLPAEGPSATWPYGLPLPRPGAPRRERLPLALATTNLSYNLNLGVLIRSAEAAGAREVLVAGRDFYHRAAAMGADDWVDLAFFDTIEELVDHARSSGYQLVAVQQSPGAERFDRADYPPRPCLILGSEGPGLPPHVVAGADLVVEIPQRGEIDSLNVSCAATLVLWACLSSRGWV
jgi:HEAT repeat protein/tRNA(Leu) C34 or U34 (ribose-2'-O)-methylase TrmL